MSLHVSVDTGCNMGCSYCVSPDTKVLMHDLSWKRIDSVQEGENVIAFDYKAEDTRYKMYREAEIEAVHSHESLAVDVHTDKGVITAEYNHPFYTQKGNKPKFRGANELEKGDEIYYFVEPEKFEESDEYKQGYIVGSFAGDGSIPAWKDRKEYDPSQGLNNREAYISSVDEEVGEKVVEYSEDVFDDHVFALKEKRYNGNPEDSALMASTPEGDTLVDVFDKFDESREYMRGWLAGMFDTDGTYPKGVNVVFCQYTGEIFDTVCEYLDELGYSWVHDEGKEGDFSDMIRVVGGKKETYGLLTEIRPKVERKYKSFIGNNRVGGTATVEKIVERGEEKLYDLTTSESTFIADGFLSRNCYEDTDRTVKGNDVTDNYDMDAILSRLEKFKQTTSEIPGLHGGEPLLLRDDDIEEIFEWVYENYPSVRRGEKHINIQTNGTLINDNHIEMFKKYNVNVGISCDGPPELNIERKSAGNPDATDDLSEITNNNIFDLAQEDGVSVGIIVVVHETNVGTDEKLEKLLSWMDDLNKLGVSGHFNEVLPYDDIQTELAISSERMKEVYLRTWEWMKEEPYRTWNPMRQFQDNLLGLGLQDCRVAMCDPFDAGAAKIVDGDGETSGCGKTWEAVGDGTSFLQGPSNGTQYNDDEDRERILKQLPGAPETEGPDLGGCKGCEYWSICHGGCPSAGMDQDHRNRTRWCDSKYYLYKRIEKDMRKMFPNIRLVTDLPWDAKIEGETHGSGLDIGQFAAMNPARRDGEKSVYAGYETDVPPPQDMVSEEAIPDRSQEEIIREFKEQYGEEDTTVEIDGDEIITHADSDMGENE